MSAIRRSIAALRLSVQVPELIKQGRAVVALAPGDVLVDPATGARFRVGDLIGRGGMGEVYRGEIEGSGREIAIKTIPLALASDPKIALRTQFESEALRSLHHPNIVHVHASGVREDGVIFMVMEYLPGLTLHDLRRVIGKIPIAWSIEIMRDVCAGLDAIHVHAIHRDIKPANLHFGTDAIVRVLDLGAARWQKSGLGLTSAGTQLGTLAYMAPELINESAPALPAADLWSAGVVLYELLADRHPFAFEGSLPDNRFVLGERIIDDPHIPLRDVAPLCPGALAQLVDRALEKDWRRRIESAAEMARALTHAMEAFAREHGEAPPLATLAERAFPGEARPARRASQTGAKASAVKALASTAPLDSSASRAQPAALPYLRTDGVTDSATADAVRLALIHGPGAAESAASPARDSESAAVRSSGVVAVSPAADTESPAARTSGVVGIAPAATMESPAARTSGVVGIPLAANTASPAARTALLVEIPPPSIAEAPAARMSGAGEIPPPSIVAQDGDLARVSGVIIPPPPVRAPRRRQWLAGLAAVALVATGSGVTWLFLTKLGGEAPAPAVTPTASAAGRATAAPAPAATTAPAPLPASPKRSPAPKAPARPGR